MKEKCKNERYFCIRRSYVNFVSTAVICYFHASCLDEHLICKPLEQSSVTLRRRIDLKKKRPVNTLPGIIEKLSGNIVDSPRKYARVVGPHHRRWRGARHNLGRGRVKLPSAASSTTMSRREIQNCCFPNQVIVISWS